MLFDAPSVTEKFETRLNYIYNLAEKLNSPYLKAHVHSKCLGVKDLENRQETVKKLGGEGLMLRKPESFYEFKRSNTLLKVKSFFDAEATVVGILNGSGRLDGMMGSLIVRTDDAVEFKIGSGFTDLQRKNPPKVGDRVTYKFQELSDSGKPRFPVFLRLHPGI